MKKYRIECVIIIAISIIFTYAAAVSISQDKISSEILRLHILASSNNPHDQEIKLIVRDAVLDFCTPLLKDAKERREVEQIITKNMQKIANIAKKTLVSMGEDKKVIVSLKEEYYPTRDYKNFSLPAGKYLGLKIVIGEGYGKNWWCVVFPPMCNEVAQKTKGQNNEDLPPKYSIKFKTAEIIGNIRSAIFG